MPIRLQREGYLGSPGVVERKHGDLNGVNWVEVVPAPGEGTIFQVIAVTMPNTTGGPLIASLRINDGLAGTQRIIDHVAAVAAGTTYSSADKLPVILIRDNDSLQMATTAAAVPTFYAEWAVWKPILEGGGL